LLLTTIRPDPICCQVGLGVVLRVTGEEPRCGFTT
jgi:hypothetical protein